MASTVRKYAKKITEDGIQMWCRGCPIAIPVTSKPGNGDVCTYTLLAAATLTESFCAAAVADPFNEFVVGAAERGLTHVLILNPRTPSDVS
eukprot:4260169-Pyramimonas_sp.AAC.1